MEDLYFYLDNIKTELDKSEVIKSLESAKKKVYENKELISLIKLYHQNKSEKLRKEIYQYQDFIKYKEKENELNFLILNINNILKDITNKKGCCK